MEMKNKQNEGAEGDGDIGKCLGKKGIKQMMLLVKKSMWSILVITDKWKKKTLPTEFAFEKKPVHR